MILLTEKHNILKTPQAREQQVQEHLPSVAITNIRRGQEDLLGVADRVKGRGSGTWYDL